MKSSTRALTVVTLIATLGTGAALASGVVEFPDEVRSSSVKLPRGAKKSELPRYAKIDRQQAEAAALAVDAGNGQVLAMEAEEEDDEGDR